MEKRMDLTDLIKALKESGQKTKSYDTTATVRRIQGNIAWVHIPGGVDETPVKMTVKAKAGDTVQVRVAEGKAWITGNETAPPTDDVEAVKAKQTATEAKDKAKEANDTAEQAETIAENAVSSAQVAATAANNAQISANNAQISANNAQESANAAQTSANNAQTSANSAKESAINANEYASRALGNLSTVQSVAETLTWITEHGAMTKTKDLTPDPTHVYFVRDSNGDYQVGNYKYSIVNEPEQAAMSSYYELSIDESLNNYVGTHLALTDEGLWLLPAGQLSEQPLVDSNNDGIVDHDNNTIVLMAEIDAQYASGYKVLIATGAGSTYTSPGTYIIDSIGTTIAYFGTFMRIGPENDTHLETTNDGLLILNGSNGVIAGFKPNLIQLLKGRAQIQAIGFGNNNDGEVRYNINNGSDNSYHSFYNKVSAVKGLNVYNGFGFRLREDDPIMQAQVISSWEELISIMIDPREFFQSVPSSEWGPAEGMPNNTHCYIGSDATAQAWGDLPNGQNAKAGHLLTFGKSDRYVQFYIERDGDSNIYVGNNRTGTWSGWKKITTTAV